MTLCSCLAASSWGLLVVPQHLDKQQPLYRVLYRQTPYGARGSYDEDSLKLLEILAEETQHHQMGGRCDESSRILLRRSYSMALQSTVLRSKVRGMPVLLKYPPPDQIRTLQIYSTRCISPVFSAEKKR